MNENMQTVEIPSMGLRAKCLVYKDPKSLDTDAGQEGRTLFLANKYLAEKVALVNFRAAVVAKLVELLPKFPFPHDIIEGTDAEGKKTSKKVLKSEVRCVTALRNAAIQGKVEGWPKDKDTVNAKLQEISDALGAFKADAKKQVRVPKAKKPRALCLKGADNIIANKSQAKWAKKFTDEGISFAPFDGKDPEQNRLNLAWAIQNREDKNTNEYA